MPATRRSRTVQRMRVTGASAHNLKDIDVDIPLGLFTCVTGVSGSGKSTLVHDVIYAASSVRRATGIGRSARTGRSKADRVHHRRRPRGPAADRPDAAVESCHLSQGVRPDPRVVRGDQGRAHAGLTASHFSFNVPGGRCEACEGEGVVRVEMQFLADVFVPCDQCDGKRFRPQVLEVRYKGKNIDQVLDLTVREALTFFAARQSDCDGCRCSTRSDSATFASDSPPRRFRAAKRSASRSRRISGRSRRTHALRARRADDGTALRRHREAAGRVRKLLEAGHSLLVIEHNLDVLKTADWIIDLGPRRRGRRRSVRRHARANRQGSGVGDGSISRRFLPRARSGRTLTNHDPGIRLVAIAIRLTTSRSARRTGPVSGRHPQPAASEARIRGSRRSCK